MKDLHGRIVNSVEQSRFTFGKELQLHVMEIKPNQPFKSPVDFEETMQEAVLFMNDFLQRKYGAKLLGTGMHPLLRLDETGVWPHRHKQIYRAYSRVFDLRRHGWLNIQSFQLNLPFADEKSGVLLHNALAVFCAYLPAVAASSPICESAFGRDVDNRLRFYRENQREVPSVTGDVIPEYVISFKQYHREIIGKYSSDLANAGADPLIIDKEWVNSRGVIFRFDRKAVEIRVMDEQECVKSDVALSCFIRAALRGLMKEKIKLPSHRLLAEDFDSVVRQGLDAGTKNPCGQTARQVCQHFFKLALENASQEERKYLPIIRKRIERGNLSQTILERIKRKAQKTDFKEAVIDMYSAVAESLMDNEPYF